MVPLVLNLTLGKKEEFYTHSFENLKKLQHEMNHENTTTDFKMAATKKKFNCEYTNSMFLPILVNS